MRYYLGIDPGLSGAFALVAPGGALVDTVDMPTLAILRNRKSKREIDVAAVADFMRVRKHQIDCAFLEKVGAMPGQGVTSMFAFGKSTGIVVGVLGALEIPLTHLAPQKWKKTMSVSGGKDGSRQRALELWPRQSAFFARKMDHARADAALVAECGRRMLEGG